MSNVETILVIIYIEFFYFSIYFNKRIASKSKCLDPILKVLKDVLPLTSNLLRCINFTLITEGPEGVL